MTSPILARVIAEPITSECMPPEFSRPENGAELVFWGVVRNSSEGKQVLAVTYDARVALAERTFREIGDEACARWGDQLRVVIVHRVGRLAAGVASVLVSSALPHRDEAYGASRYVIEQLESRVAHLEAGALRGRRRRVARGWLAATGAARAGEAVMVACAVGRNPVDRRRTSPAAVTWPARLRVRWRSGRSRRRASRG